MVSDKKEYMKEYRKTPQYKKSHLIGNWKYKGLIGDYEAIYKRYVNTTHCDLCNVELCDGNKLPNRKCMEHNHDTGEFRNIVCNSCNCKKTDKKKRTNNTSGYKNICYNNTHKFWVYKKIFKGETIYITNKDKIKILCIKFAAILLYKY
jgi:hypothetical protein